MTPSLSPSRHTSTPVPAPPTVAPAGGVRASVPSPSQAASAQAGAVAAGALKSPYPYFAAPPEPPRC